MKNVFKTTHKKISRAQRVPAVAGICLIIACVFQTGCKKLLEINPPIDKTAATTVYSSTAFAVQAMTGIYADFIPNHAGVTGKNTETRDQSLCLAYTADELAIVSARNNSSYTNTYTVGDDPGGPYYGWTGYYTFIYRVNAILDGVNASTGIPVQGKAILTGEAKFMRALLYFYLVNQYGDVPLITTSAYSQNIDVPRTPKDQVYAQMVKDLLDAQSNLTDNYLSLDLSTATTEKIRPNKVAATALLARVYLYMGKWAEAEAEATKVIGNSNYSLLTDLNSVFLKNSGEAIWQLQPNQNVGPPWYTANTFEAAYLIPSNGDSPQWAVSGNLLAAMEPGDLRQADWLETIDDGFGDLYPIPFKYKLGQFQLASQEYIMVLRLAEQYLIRAEARAQQNNVTGANSAQTDVDAIRSRAGLAGTTATSKTDMLTEIAKQRFAELFMEWGDRWYDLKRTGKIDSVMTVACPEKGGVWNSNKALFPIPANEFLYNAALHGHQNPGYSEQ